MQRVIAATFFYLMTLGVGNAADKLIVLLDWFVNPDHAPLIVAQQNGYFDDVELDVTLVPPADPSAPPRLVAAGEADIAITYQPSLYLQIQEGLPLVRFGTLVATPLNTLVVLADGPIQSLAGLKGKSVGFSVAGFEEALLQQMLSSVGLSTSDLTLINVNFALSPALITGKVDAVIGAFRNFELTQLDLEGEKGRAFYPEEHGVPPYDELIFVARQDVLADDERFSRFLSAIERAALFITNNPQAGLKAFLSAHPDLDNELNKRAYVDTMPRFSKSPAALDRRRYQRFAQFMFDQGLITEIPVLDRYAIALD